MMLVYQVSCDKWARCDTDHAIRWLIRSGSDQNQNRCRQVSMNIYQSNSVQILMIFGHGLLVHVKTIYSETLNLCLFYRRINLVKSFVHRFGLSMQRSLLLLLLWCLRENGRVVLLFCRVIWIFKVYLYVYFNVFAEKQGQYNVHRIHLLALSYSLDTRLSEISLIHFGSEAFSLSNHDQSQFVFGFK